MKNWMYVLIVFTCACSPRFKVGSDFDPAVDFTRFATFKKDQKNLFTKRSSPILNSELTKKRMDYAIVQELVAKGYEQTDNNPDLIFSYQTASKEKQEVSQVNNNPNWGWNRWAWGPWGPWGGMPNQTIVRDYEESTIIIDVRNAKNGELVWQGWVIGELKYNENDWAERIQDAVKTAMKNFPAKNGITKK